MATTNETTAQSAPLDTLTDQAMAAVRNMLELGELGEPIPPDRQLAELLGISRVTMRRAMAALEDSGLIRREQGRGTFSCFGPRIVGSDELQTFRQPLLAVLTEQEGERFNPQITPWTWQICRHLLRRLSRDKLQLHFVNSYDFLSAAQQGRLDACDLTGFVAPTHVWQPATYETAFGLGLPFVGIGRTSKSLYWNILDLDHRTGLREALDDLQPQADDRVFIPLEPHPAEVDRQLWLETVMHELSRRGLSAYQMVVKAGGMFESQGYLATKWYLREYDPPTIVLADFDLCLVGVYRALQAARESGTIRASDLQRLRCLGGGDLAIGRCVTPAFGTLRYSSSRMASLILQMLQQQHRTRRPVGLRYLQAKYLAPGSRRQKLHATNDSKKENILS